MTTNEDLDLLTIAEAAQILKVSTITVHRWLKSGRLPADHLCAGRILRCVRRAPSRLPAAAPSAAHRRWRLA